MANRSKDRVLAYLAQGMARVDIAELMGVSPNYITRVATNAGITLPKNRPGPRRLNELLDYGSLHRQIGTRLRHAYRVERDMTVEEVASHLGMSCPNVTNSGDAAYNFRLTELQKIAEFLDITLVELLTEAPTRFAVVSSK